jgi:hypothetical protein
MNASSLVSRLLPPLLSGAKRSAIPLASATDGAFPDDDPGAPLKALALAGRALAFSRPETPAAFDAVSPLPADRAFVAGTTRATLLAFASKPGDAIVARACEFVAEALESARLAPHPFDLDSMEGFVRANASRLGEAAYAWSRRSDTSGDAEGYADSSSIDDANWSKYGLAVRESYLGKRRRDDPEAARALLESVWASSPADARYRLLKRLEVNLSASDGGFLEGAAKDRAPRVRELAAALADRLAPGDASAAIRDLASRIKRETKGLLSKRETFSLEFPATVKDHGRVSWIAERFGAVCVSPIARALELDPADLVAGSAGDGWLALALYAAAANERRFDLIEPLADARPDAWDELSAAGWLSDALLDRATFERLSQAAVRPERWDASVDRRAILAYARLPGLESLPPSCFVAVERSLWAEAALAGSDSSLENDALLLATMCPRERRGRLLSRMDDDEATRRARDYLALLDELESKGGPR